MKATIWHNPRCSKSREALAILRDAGADVTVIDYQKTPPLRDELARVLGVTRPRDERVTGADGAVQEIADENGKWIDAVATAEGAIAWSAGRGARSGRVAWQFIQDLAGEMGVRLTR